MVCDRSAAPPSSLGRRTRDVVRLPDAVGPETPGAQMPTKRMVSFSLDSGGDDAGIVPLVPSKRQSTGVHGAIGTFLESI